MRRALGLFILMVLSCGVVVALDNEFPEGILGEIYFCPRIDLVPGDQGGPLEIELDGVLDDEVWARASWHGWVHSLGNPLGDIPNDLSPENDLSFEWAAVCDTEFLYVAWRVRDESLQNIENFQCDVWNDDSVEFYVDMGNDGPECDAAGANCYGPDDAQFTIGMENDGNVDPQELVVGGLAGGGNCDFSGPHPELCQGMVQQTFEGELDVYAGWTAEVAIALETIGNNDDGTPTWLVTPEHASIIGWNIHGQDDDDGGGRDHKLAWSSKENIESSWRNPGIYGKLIFIDPTKPVPDITAPVGNLSCTRNEDGTMSLTWTNPADANVARPISIEVDDEEVTTVDGSSESAELTEEQVPLDEVNHTIAVRNSGGIPTECTILQSLFDECGGILRWNLLGGFLNPGGAAPGIPEIQRDYLTDGDTTELDFVWFPGATINTQFNGAAASTGIDGGAAGRNPGGLPTVFARDESNSRVFFGNPDAFGNTLTDVMAYAQIYVTAEEDTDVYLGISSDDSVQVLVNGVEVWINNLGRGGDTACNPQDNPLDPVVFEEGTSSLMVKVFQGTGGWDFSLALKDVLGNPLTEGLSLSLYPEDFCTVPPLVANRTIADVAETILIQGVEEPRWSPEATYSVTLSITDIREAGVNENCPDAPTQVTITETVPAGWQVPVASNEGEINAGVITWTLMGDDLAEGELIYQVEAGEDQGDVVFSGEIQEQGSTLSFGIGGDSRLFNPTDFTPEGFVKTMLLLGPYRQPAGGGAEPGEVLISGDYLTDGADIEELDVEPRVGDTVNTDFLIATSAGLASPVTPNGINPGDVPTWAEWRDRDDTIDFNDYYGGDVNTIMMYAVFYVLVEEDELVVDIGLASDDSVQVLLDGQEIHINNIPRPVGNANEVQDTIFSINVEELNPLTPGLHKVMVKVFDGDGDHGFRLRFQDPVTGLPVTEGLKICLSPDPEECGGIIIEGTPFIRGDANADASVNISDASYILNFLFLGGPDPTCIASTDANGDGNGNISDASYILNFLFLGGPDIPPPNVCQAVPDVDCEVFEPCP